MKKTLSIILSLMLISLCIVSCDNNTSTTSLKSIEVTTKPTKLTYTVGESLNTADMVVTATYSNGTSKVVTGFTVDTSVLSTVGTKTVTVSFTQNGVTRTASFDVTVKYPPFTVTFVKNDASAKELDFEAKTVDYGKAYGTLPEIKKDNYTFLGWYDAPSGGNKVTENTTVTKASNHYLYAQWIENGKFRVTFKCEDNDNKPNGTVPADITGYIGQKIILPGNVGTVPLTKTGYTFNGWAPKDESYNSGAFITASEERLITLYAQWKANEYSIIYKDKDGETFSGTYGENYPTKHTYDKVTTLVNPTKTGYTFDGWYIDSECSSGNKVTTIGATAKTADFTLYAKWALIITTFNLNGKYTGGGTPVVAGTTDNTKTTGYAFKLPGMVYYSNTDQTKGYAVTKWNTESDGSGTDYVAGESYTPSTSQTLYIKEGHSWVQLWSGGPKWAEFNIGSTITDYASATGATIAEKYTTANVGDYYKWGATTASTGSPSSSVSDIQGTADDTAKAIWGDIWQMPKQADFQGLLDTSKCTAVWVETGYGSLKGLKVTGNTTGYTENSIFLPAAGDYNNSQDTNGIYWSSIPEDSVLSLRLEFNSSSYKSVTPGNRGGVFSVRAVLKY